MKKTAIQTADAPGAIGPYSQAIVSGDLVFLSGQIPLDPATGELIEGDITAETHQVMKNLGAVLAAAGASFGDVLKTTIYLKDMADFQAMNAAYASYFLSEPTTDSNASAAPPARATVQVAGLPKNVRVEIDAVARVPSR